LKGKIFCLLTVGLVVPLLICSCAAPAPPPSEREPLQIDIRSGKLGRSSYVLSFGLSDLINKNSTWLRATNIECKGSTESIMYIQNHPEKAASTVFWANQYAQTIAQRADAPLEKPYLGFRYIALVTMPPIAILSTDPNIRTIQDLAGKRVSVGPKGASIEYLTRFILDYGYGIWDEIKPSYLSWGACKDALLDGTIDAGVQTGEIYSVEGDWVPGPALEELFSTRECYLITYSEEAAAKAAEKSGYPIRLVSYKPTAFGKTPAQEWNGVIHYNSWCCDASMPDEVVTEIVRVIYEHADEFVSYHASGKSIRRETLAAIATDRDSFHPGAAKFYDEKGIKIGVD